jgi:hypothetical protein
MPKALDNDHAAAQRSLRARYAAFMLHSQVDGSAHTKPARAAFDQRFENEVDPDRRLPEKERRRRALIRRKAYFTELAIKSAAARRARKATAEPDGAPNATNAGPSTSRRPSKTGAHTSDVSAA